MVDLWVCPSCQVLLGIDIDKNFQTHCVSCGLIHKLEDVKFISEEFVIKIKKEVEVIFGEEYHEYIRYRWLSNKTVGIMVDFDEDEILEKIPDIYEIIEDDLSKTTNIFISLVFE